MVLLSHQNSMLGGPIFLRTLGYHYSYIYLNLSMFRFPTDNFKKQRGSICDMSIDAFA